VSRSLPSAVDPAWYPFEGKVLELDGHGYHYLDEGQGPTVVMLHGNPTWSFYYRELVRELRVDHRCLVPDHIGCGLSDKPTASEYDFHFEQRILDVEQWLDTVAPSGPITLVLHDWGGMIGMGWAARHPERVARIVLLNTAAFHMPQTKRFPPALRLARDSRLGAGLVTRFNAFAVAAASVGCKSTPMSAALRKAYVAPYDTPANRLATLRFVQDIPLSASDRGFDTISDVEAMLPKFDKLPVFIGWGDLDFVFDEHFLARWRELLPSAKVTQYPRAGHYVLEDVAQDLIPRIRAFLEDHPVAS
jgi:pimeloyl-ACP methyl ester carboxylesterase